MNFDEEVPHLWGGKAEVWELDVLVRRAPHRETGEVQVAAGEVVELASTQHEVEGEMRCSGEVFVEGAEQGQVTGMVPQLAGRGRCAGAETSGNGSTDGKVTLGEQVKLAGPTEGRHGSPDAAGTDRLSVFGKSAWQLLGERDGKGTRIAVAGKYTKGGGIC